MSDFGQFNQEFQKQAYIKEPTLAQAENPLMSLMREYVRAKEAYDMACLSHQQVQQQRVEAEKNLLALSEKVNQVVAQGVHDPTCPAPTVTNVGNGMYGSTLVYPR